MTQPEQPVHRPLVTTSSKRCFQWSFSGGIVAFSCRTGPSGRADPLGPPVGPVPPAATGGWRRVWHARPPGGSSGSGGTPRRAAGPRAEPGDRGPDRPSGLDEPGDGRHRLGELVIGVVVLGDGVAHAVLQVLVEQPEPDALEGARHRRDLREDVDAVLVLVDHAL